MKRKDKKMVLALVNDFKKGRSAKQIAGDYGLDKRTVDNQLFAAGLVTYSKTGNGVYMTRTKSGAVDHEKKEEKRKNHKNSRYFWHDHERDFPKSYAEYAKKRGVKVPSHYMPLPPPGGKVGHEDPMIKNHE